MPFLWRDVAQLGRALRSGRRGRWFESSHPDLNLYIRKLYVAIRKLVSLFANQRRFGGLNVGNLITLSFRKLISQTIFDVDLIPPPL